jgi:hypothetical protein
MENKNSERITVGELAKIVQADPQSENYLIIVPNTILDKRVVKKMLMGTGQRREPIYKILHKPSLVLYHIYYNRKDGYSVIRIRPEAQQE